MMAKPSYYFDLLGLARNNEKTLFDHLIETLQPTNRTWDYFVDWKKVKENIRQCEIQLNLLNTLIGKSDIEEAATSLFNEYPEAKTAIPILFAVRDKDFHILEDYQGQELKHKEYEISEKTDTATVVKVMREIGLLSLIQNKEIKSIPDYVMGIEVGLNTNARKNRGGDIMEEIVEYFLKSICSKNNWQYLKEVDNTKLKNAWGVQLSTGQAKKRIDFAVKTPNRIFLIEANFYSGGGSKLKSTANEYCNVWDTYGHPFIWITDGKGWEGDNSLKDAFETIDHVINLDMVQKGVLEEIIKKG